MEGKKGFTIIEILIALVVMAIMFAGILPLMAKAINANKEVRLRLVAYELASQQLEEYRERKIPSLLPSTTNTPTLDLPEGNIAVTIEKPRNPNQTLATVIVNVSWRFNSKDQKIELKTYLYGSTL